GPLSQLAGMLMLGEQKLAQLAFDLGGFLFQRFVGAALDLFLLHLALELLVGDGGVAGDLVDAKVLVQVFEIIFLSPAVKDQVDDLAGRPLTIIGQNAHLHSSVLGISGAHDELAHLGVFGPVLINVFETVNALVLSVVAGPFQRILARTLLRVPLARPEILLPSDEVIVW